MLRIVGLDGDFIGNRLLTRANAGVCMTVINTISGELLRFDDMCRVHLSVFRCNSFFLLILRLLSDSKESIYEADILF